ncbi:alpha/beta fold hydrolase [Undibacterium terreum]|uniref:Epoxide hydrolase n=1 Tax=Undibacterium terreum TaxID=1224302 RepID=A0A916ULH3_9BURK|nr:alpha/beta hydrolase [Undibacterium terreum]GGC77624.1 epoxide hydrolase [Undibacterium terreum]
MNVIRHRMNGFLAQSLSVLALAAALVTTSNHTAAAETASAFQSKDVQVNGVRIHYRIGGHGSPVVLLHGYAETSAMWNPIMDGLAKTHTVIVPDLRGAGASEKTVGGYDKKNMAKDIHELVAGVTSEPAVVVGHDIGLMVAYAYAAQYPQDTQRLALLEAFLPGIGEWRVRYSAPRNWHYHFGGETPEALVQGRERIYFEHFWNDFAADRNHSLPESERQLYTASWAQPGGMRAGFAWFQAFPQDAVDFEKFSQVKLKMPVMAVAGEKSGGDFLINQTKLVAEHVDAHIIQGSGHWLMDEAPDQLIPLLLDFIH